MTANFGNRPKGEYIFAPNSKLALWLADRVFSAFGIQITTQERVCLVQAWLGGIGYEFAERDVADAKLKNLGADL